jgi:hypothetical protein
LNASKKGWSSAGVDDSALAMNSSSTSLGGGVVESTDIEDDMMGVGVGVGVGVGLWSDEYQRRNM